ncbi:MAG: J domain-containing protein [Verrucomicrobia bacterium]|nr:J domain-containing protein [Verrucomicrobiota bacterium]
MKKDYYLILRLAPQATAKEIQSAYRRRASEIHPDVSGSNSDQFLELQEAYSVLSDPSQRAAYDREAQEIPIRRIDAPRPAPTMIRRRHSAEPLIPVQPPSFLRSFETFLPSFIQEVDRLWGNFGSGGRPGTERLGSLVMEVPLSSRQAFAGGQVHVLVPFRATCPGCAGRGHVGLYQCSRCEGYGTLRDEYPVTVSYPAGLQQDYAVRMLLEDFSDENFYLIVRFRVAEPR